MMRRAVFWCPVRAATILAKGRICGGRTVVIGQRVSLARGRRLSRLCAAGLDWVCGSGCYGR